MTNKLDPELITKITKFANQIAWKKPNLDVLQPRYAETYSSLSRALQNHLKLSDFRKRLVLPDLRAFGNETVAVFSDYGGEERGSHFSTYSVLVCGWNVSGGCTQRISKIRQTHVLG